MKAKEIIVKLNSKGVKYSEIINPSNEELKLELFKKFPFPYNLFDDRIQLLEQRKVQ